MAAFIGPMDMDRLDSVLGAPTVMARDVASVSLPLRGACLSVSTLSRGSEDGCSALEQGVAMRTQRPLHGQHSDLSARIHVRLGKSCGHSLHVPSRPVPSRHVTSQHSCHVPSRASTPVQRSCPALPS